MEDFLEMEEEPTALMLFRAPVAIIQLVNPKRANALSRAVVRDLRSRLRFLAESPEFRAVILTGYGDDAFSAGADLKERAEMSLEETREFVQELRSMVDELAALPQPTIAAINGVCLGGGLELALACDIRIASDKAVLGLTETAIGVIPGAGGTQRLTQLLGPGKAKELIFTAKRLTADEALSVGLVNETIRHVEIVLRSTDLANEICQRAPLAVQAAKRAINVAVSTPSVGLAAEWEAYESILGTSDRLEGLAAFAEKRPPKFMGE